MARLVDYPSLLIIFVKFALLERVRHGDSFLIFTNQALLSIDLDNLIIRVPLPTTLKQIDDDFQAKVYQAAFSKSGGEFDSPNLGKSAASFVDFALGITEISASSWFIALIYIDRLIRRSPSVLLTTKTFHKLFATALMIAVKYQEELDIPLAVFASLAYCTSEQMIQLENRFLTAIDYRLYVSDNDIYDAEVGLMACAIFVNDNSNAIQSLKAREVTNVDEALRLKNLWNLLKLSPKKIAVVPESTALAMVHGDGRDIHRLVQARAALARVQIIWEFGSVAHDAEFLSAYAQLLTPDARDRLHSLLSMANEILPQIELQKSPERHSVQNRALDGNENLGSQPSPVLFSNTSPWSVSSDLNSPCRIDTNQTNQVQSRPVSISDHNRVRLSRLVGSDLEQEIFGSTDITVFSAVEDESSYSVTGSYPTLECG